VNKFLLDGRHIQDHFPGIGRYVFNLARGLTRMAPDVDFRLLHNPGAKNTRFNIGSLASVHNMELVGVRAQPWSFEELVLGMDQKVMKDAVLWHSAYYAMLYSPPVPLVLTLEDAAPLVLRETMPSAGKRLLYRGLCLLATRRAARVITLSKSASKDIRRTLGVPLDKISVISLAAEEVFHLCEDAEIAAVRDRLGLPERYTLYLGSNKPHKNLVRLVQAWALVVSDSVLVLAGHWEARHPETKRMAEELGLGDRILFRHNVSSGDLPALVAGAEVFVFPSTYEGFGLPVLEAMASGAPVVCSNTSSLPEVVGEAALLFNPFAVDEIASTLTSALADARLREALVTKGLARARCYSWDRTACETLQVYEAVVGDR
jgi:glycosyltransferase involved in cell wall biosynthesis